MALDIVAWGAITFGLTVFIQGIFFAIATFFKTDKVNLYIFGRLDIKCVL